MTRNVVRVKFLALTRGYLEQGATISHLQSISLKKQQKHGTKKVIFSLTVPLLCSLVFIHLYTVNFTITRCLIPNNYLIWEFTRPVSDCEFCRGVNSALVLENLTKAEFRRYAYSSKPIIVKKAASHWLASKVFSLQFFRNLYEGIHGAYESVDEECQFLHFRSDFANLKEVFSMSARRAMNLPGEKSWYVGWKNCHPQILDIMKKFYQPPHFLPDDAEIPNTNYIFLGYEKGAVMHVGVYFSSSVLQTVAVSRYKIKTLVFFEAYFSFS